MRSFYKLSTEEAYRLVSGHCGHPLPPPDAVENEDWGRDYVLQHLLRPSTAELVAVGLTWEREAGEPDPGAQPSDSQAAASASAARPASRSHRRTRAAELPTASSLPSGAKGITAIFRLTPLRTRTVASRRRRTADRAGSPAPKAEAVRPLADGGLCGRLAPGSSAPGPGGRRRAACAVPSGYEAAAPGASPRAGGSDPPTTDPSVATQCVTAGGRTTRWTTTMTTARTPWPRDLGLDGDAVETWFGRLAITPAGRTGSQPDRRSLAGKKKKAADSAAASRLGTRPAETLELNSKRPVAGRGTGRCELGGGDACPPSDRR